MGAKEATYIIAGGFRLRSLETAGDAMSATGRAWRLFIALYGLASAQVPRHPLP